MEVGGSVIVVTHCDARIFDSCSCFVFCLTKNISGPALSHQMSATKFFVMEATRSQIFCSKVAN